MHIKVLQHHIDAGYRADLNWCPVALAIREQVPGVKTVNVGTICISLHGDDSAEQWYTPPDVADFIQNFDSGYIEVEPFEFDLHDPLVFKG